MPLPWRWICVTAATKTKERQDPTHKYRKWLGYPYYPYGPYGYPYGKHGIYYDEEKQDPAPNSKLKKLLYGRWLRYPYYPYGPYRYGYPYGKYGIDYDEEK